MFGTKGGFWKIDGVSACHSVFRTLRTKTCSIVK